MSVNRSVYYRQLAVARRRDPEQDTRNAAASAAMLVRVEAEMAHMPLIQALNAAALLQVARMESVSPADGCDSLPLASNDASVQSASAPPALPRSGG